MKLEDRSALVTGAGSGIGRAIARLYAKEGAKVMVSDIDEDAGLAVAAEIEDAGGDAKFVRTDTSKEDDVRAAVAATVDAWGALDVLVNNAGIAGVENTWERVIAVNLSGVYYGCQHGLEAMKGKGGAIVNMASMAGLVGFKLPGFNVPSLYAYIASKHGVMGLTKQFAIEAGPHNVRVNAICPGWIETAMTAPLLEMKPLTDWMVEGAPLGRVAGPDEVAKAALFLAGDDASFSTGSYLVMDGGWTAA